MYLKTVTDRINLPVFFGSHFILVIILITCLFFQEKSARFFKQSRMALLESGGWFFIASLSILLIGLIHLTLFHGKMKLSSSNESPEFSRLTWFSMLFSAGLGIGLLYSAVYEPLFHYFHAPQIQPLNDPAKFIKALDLTFFHWGILPWILYSSSGLLFAYFGFVKNRTLDYGNVIPPSYKILKRVLNILAIISVLAGLLVAFAYGSSQIVSGLQKVFPSLPNSFFVQSLIILSITVIATLSVLTGLNRGIRRLSEFNIILTIVIFILSVVSLYDLPTFLNTTQIFAETLSLHTKSLFSNLVYQGDGGGEKWVQNWTFFFWAWWVSWCPFVGLFIAKISKGRSIREFVLFTIGIPTLFSFIWFTYFSAIAKISHDSAAIDFKTMTLGSPPDTLFALLELSPIFNLLLILILVSIILYYVTSSDSGSYVLHLMTTKDQDNAPMSIKVYWSLLEGLLAIALLGFGGVAMVKDLVILSSVPLLIYLVFGMIYLNLNLLREARQK